MQTIRECVLGKFTLRILKDKTGYAGVLLNDKGRQALLHGNDKGELWQRLEEAAAQAGKDYVGFDGARARFLRACPAGFSTPAYLADERNWKLKAKARLDTSLPLEQAIDGKDMGEAALGAYRATNLLAQFEMMRVTDLLRSASADGFVRAAARFTCGGGASALAQMAHLAKSHEAAKWTVVTYLPYLWRPETHMFLKPEVTKDFASRVGHPFVNHYAPTLDITVYDSLIDLASRTEREIADLSPHDRIDVQSFIWVVGQYGSASQPITTATAR